MLSLLTSVSLKMSHMMGTSARAACGGCLVPGEVSPLQDEAGGQARLAMSKRADTSESEGYVPACLQSGTTSAASDCL